MIEFLLDSRTSDNFAPFRTAVQKECPDVRFAWIGGNLLVVGTVRAYSLKALIDRQAKENELMIQNCVRVVPGHQEFAPEKMPLAG